MGLYLNFSLCLHLAPWLALYSWTSRLQLHGGRKRVFAWCSASETLQWFASWPEVAAGLAPIHWTRWPNWSMWHEGQYPPHQERYWWCHVPSNVDWIWSYISRHYHRCGDRYRVRHRLRTMHWCWLELLDKGSDIPYSVKILMLILHYKLLWTWFV